MKTKTIKQVITQLEDFAPPSIAPFDYVGVLSRSRKKTVSKIALTLDPTIHSIREAARQRCDFLITHHGPNLGKFNNTSNLDRQRIREANQNDMSIYRMHLNLDFCKNGIQQTFCEIMRFTSLEPVSVVYNHHTLNPGAFISDDIITLSEAINRVKRIHPETIRIVDTGKKIFHRTAITAGEGLVPSFLEQLHPDLFISGELNHIAIVRAFDLGITLIEVTHASSESEPLKRIAKKIEQLLHLPVHFIDSTSRSHVRSIL